MLWRKLTRAMLAIGRESNIASAAHASAFADAAHLKSATSFKAGATRSTKLSAVGPACPANRTEPNQRTEIPMTYETNDRCGLRAECEAAGATVVLTG